MCPHPPARDGDGRFGPVGRVGRVDLRRTGVLLVTDQRLLGQAVAAALSARGLTVTVCGVKEVPAVVPSTAPSTAVRSSVPGAASAVTTRHGLLLVELDRWAQVVAATELVERVPMRWLVITDTPRGPAWGAVLAAGAIAVIPASLGVTELVAALVAGVHPRAGRTAAQGRTLESQWQQLEVRREAWVTRIRRLTPRERAVMEHLRRGHGPGETARLLGISTATVRTHLRRAFVKLQVTHQLAAIARYGEFLEHGELPADVVG